MSLTGEGVAGPLLWGRIAQKRGPDHADGLRGGEVND